MGVFILKLHQSFQKSIERVFFGGRSTRASVYISYIIGNSIVMLLIFYVLLDEAVLDWTGSLHPIGSGISLAISGLDNAIPFVPQMAVFYVYIFGSMIIPTMLYFAFVEYKRGYAVGWSFVFIEVIAAIIYIILPVSVYQYHEELLAVPIGTNWWIGEVHNIVSDFGSTFNTFPSLHAAGSTVCVYTWYQHSKLHPNLASKILAILSVIAAIGIILSTLFIKQHYVADEAAGVVLGWGVSRVTFDHLWKQPEQLKPMSKSNLAKKKRRQVRGGPIATKGTLLLPFLAFCLVLVVEFAL
jgi:membrane-associated phospholipid phosphatase